MVCVVGGMVVLVLGVNLCGRWTLLVSSVLDLSERCNVRIDRDGWRFVSSRLMFG